MSTMTTQTVYTYVRARTHMSDSQSATDAKRLRRWRRSRCELLILRANDAAPRAILVLRRDFAAASGDVKAYRSLRASEIAAAT